MGIVRPSRAPVGGRDGSLRWHAAVSYSRSNFLIGAPGVSKDTPLAARTIGPSVAPTARDTERSAHRSAGSFPGTRRWSDFDVVSVATCAAPSARLYVGQQPAFRRLFGPAMRRSLLPNR
jgi:hypothetical protein